MHPRAGALGEGIAAAYLELQGYEVLARGVRIAGVQVDLIARRGTTLVVVEVKLRATRRAVAADSVGTPQRRRLVRAAHTLLARERNAECVRIDAVGIDVHTDGLALQHWTGVAAGD